ETVTVDGGTYSWSSSLSSFSITNSQKVYLEPTVKKLSNSSLWTKFSEINFVGPNVISADSSKGNVFSNQDAPLTNLNGTYYVTDDGMLYLLEPVAKNAAFAYCPPGITELKIPTSITADEGLAQDSQYDGEYKVTGVTSHSINMASDLTKITATNPSRISLAVRAFADCETLTSVNGVTTQKEANALFGTNGTSKMQKAFINTGLDPDTDSSGGKPMRSPEYIDVDTGRLQIIANNTANNLKYDDGAYRLLTGESANITIKAETFGTPDKLTHFEVYLFPSGDLQGISKDDQTFTSTFVYNNNNTSGSFDIHLKWDSISSCYCMTFDLPGGVTWVSGSAFLQNLYYPGRTKGGDVMLWGSVKAYSAEIPSQGTSDETTQLPENTQYMMLEWETVRNLYEYKELTIDDFNNSIDNTIQTYVDDNHKTHIRSIGIRDYLNFRDDQLLNNNSQIGKDPVTSVLHTYTITLPEGLTWNTDNFSSDDKPKVKSVSEDGRTLVFAEEIYYNRSGNDTDTGPHIANIEWRDYFPESYFTVSNSYDYYVPHEVTCKLEGTVNYKFSAPDEMQPVTATATITPLTPDIEYGRSYQSGNTMRDGTERQKGRGLPVENYLTVKNNGAVPDSPGNLYSITDEVINYNGYAYLSAEQIAALFLEENDFTDIKSINIRKVVLYEANDSLILDGTHTDTDGNENSVNNTRFNKYTEPEYSNARMVFEIMAGDSSKIDFSVYSDDSETAERIYNETFD
ncbi:MAG: hypothetical protein ACI4RN_05745, partial [Oscillospiraceae bacterium]